MADCPNCKRMRRALDVMSGALEISARFAGALQPLIPPPESLDPEMRAKWQEVVNVVFDAADYADVHGLGTETETVQ